MSETFLVKKVDLFKGFGNVYVDDGSKWGKRYGTGQKTEPPCSAGDTITATPTKNSGGYDELKDIMVVDPGSVSPPKPTTNTGGGNKGSQFRSIPELNRVDALNIALKNRNEPTMPEDIIADAETFFKYISEGTIPAIDPLAGEDDIPY